MPDINNLISAPAKTLKINWSAVEDRLGFHFYENIKNFYSSETISPSSIRRRRFVLCAISLS